MSDSLTTIYVELDQCPSHHAILLTQGRICEIFMKKFWELAILKNGHFWKTAILDFFFQKKNFFCFILMKISPNLYGRMDGLKFWCFPWFPENSLVCVILRYTVYVPLNNSNSITSTGYVSILNLWYCWGLDNFIKLFLICL